VGELIKTVSEVYHRLRDYCLFAHWYL